jgi:hypothetical protein
VLYAGKVEGKEFFTYNVKVMWRHGETSQLALSDKGNTSEIKRVDVVTELPQPISSCGTERTTTLK